jgi:Ni,Fe-hydrogenase III small subunit
MSVLLRQLEVIRRTARLPRDTPRSVAIRHVDAGSCNGCEHERRASLGPVYDLQRFGLAITASPRHADVLLVTGPVTTRMRDALLAAYDAMPDRRLVAALGDCALACGVLGDPREMLGALERVLPVAMRIPGCPPTPSEIPRHLLDGLDAVRRPGDPIAPEPPRAP